MEKVQLLARFESMQNSDRLIPLQWRLQNIILVSVTLPEVMLLNSIAKYKASRRIPFPLQAFPSGKN